MPFKLSRTDRQELRDTTADIDELGDPKRFGRWVRICERVPVYLDKERFLVIKQPRLIYNPRTPLKFRVPTIKIDDYGWVAQPYCEKYRLKEAVEILRKKLGDGWYDIHHLNVGWYLGKPVLFDW
jgi:hypothetical protein